MGASGEHRGTGFAGPLVLPPGRGLRSDTQCASVGGEPYFIRRTRRSSSVMKSLALRTGPPAILTL